MKVVINERFRDIYAAEYITRAMRGYICEYGHSSIGDLYEVLLEGCFQTEILEHSAGGFTMYRYGWTSPNAFRIVTHKTILGSYGYTVEIADAKLLYD